ncbi:MAG: hypothetical protein IKR72_03535 [Bacteroidales bacterium]|nr:hypothetical protein [Bacteroidales bacterium]
MIGRLAAIFAAALALLAGTAPARAGEPARQAQSARVLYGVEWGYDLTLIDSYHRNYTDAVDGYRIDDEGIKAMFYSNGHAAAHIDLEFARKFGVGLYAGYAGIEQRSRFYPLSLRFSYFAKSFDTDGSFYFLEGGAGIHESRNTVSPFGKLGYGYRMNLTRRASMDFSASARCAFDHPPVYDDTNRGYVEEEFVRRSDSLYGALVFSISLNF